MAAADGSPAAASRAPGLGPPTERVLAQLTHALAASLGPELRALVLTGSAVDGGFEPDASDLDLLVVTQRDPDETMVEGLEAVRRMVVRAEPAWADRLELVVVGVETLARFRSGGPLAVVSPGEPFHLRDGIELWLANLYLVRVSGKRLVGPAIDTLIPPITVDAFLDAVVEYARELHRRDLAAAGPGGRAYTVLSACRAARTVASGGPCSKAEGAAWVAARHPEAAALIAAALACRRSGGRDGFADGATLEEARRLVALLADETEVAWRTHLAGRSPDR